MATRASVELGTKRGRRRRRDTGQASQWNSGHARRIPKVMIRKAYVMIANPSPKPTRRENSGEHRPCRNHGHDE
jgi:hypothetical protein